MFIDDTKKVSFYWEVVAEKLTGKFKLLCYISSQFVSEIEIRTNDGQMLPCFVNKMKYAFCVREKRNKRHKSIEGFPLAISVFLLASRSDSK